MLNKKFLLRLNPNQHYMMIFNFRTIIISLMITIQLSFHQLLGLVQVNQPKQKSRQKLEQLQKIKIKQVYQHFLSHYLKPKWPIKQVNNCQRLHDQNFKLNPKPKIICRLHQRSWPDSMVNQRRHSTRKNLKINECYVGVSINKYFYI